MYTRNMSDNPISADNQQERLLKTLTPSELGNYIAGFVDGEGSFNISFRSRKDYKFPWKVSACFNISQKEKSILELIRQYLQCGTLRYRSDGVWYYEVNTLKDLHGHIIPFFQKHSFLSKKKQRDFLIFQKIVVMIQSKQHLSKRGIVKIFKLRKEMNDGGKRKYSEMEILNAF